MHVQPLALRPALALFGVLASACGGEEGAGQGAAPGARPGRPHLLLVTLDTTRRDHLGCYGYERDTSPHLDRLAAGALRYDNAYATSSWTLATHASLFTGKLPTSHGAKHDPEGELRLSQGIAGPWDAYGARPIGADEVTLAQLLRGEGYATAGFVAGPWMKRVFGLDRGFEHYDDSGVTDLVGRRAKEITDAALAWLDARPQGRPFFLFLNYFDPHGPYAPPKAFRERFLPEERAGLTPGERLLALYDAEIRYMDHHLGRLLDGLRTRGLFDSTWIIVTADHGELFGENGMTGHGASLSEAEIRIPLVVKHPGPAAPTGVVERPVQQTDLLPTVLSRLDLALPPGVQGQPFDEVEHPIVAEVDPQPAAEAATKSWRQKGGWRVWIEDGWKLVWGARGRHLLFHLPSDPGEERDLAARHPGRVAEMEARLLAYLESLPRPADPLEADGLESETLEALQRLGYGGEGR